MRKYYIIIVLFICLASACENIITIPPDEPSLNNNQNLTIIGDFDVTVEATTNHQVLIRWGRASNAVSFQILVNDTLSILDIQPRTHTDNSYVINSLAPNTEHKITVRAVSADLNTKSVTVWATTRQNWITDIKQFHFDKYDYIDFFGFASYHKIDDGYYFVMAGTKPKGDVVTIIKTDKQFNILWKTDLNESVGRMGGAWIGSSISSDGGILITIANNNRSVYKVSRNGDIEWKNTDGIVRGNSIIELPNGNIIISDFSSTCLSKLSSSGETLWQERKCFGNSNSSGFKFAINEKNNSLMLFDVINVNQHRDFYLVEIDFDGNLLSENIYPYIDVMHNGNRAFAVNILPDNNNNFYLFGRGTWRFGETHIVKIDYNGNVLWERRGYEYDEWFVTPQVGFITKENNLLLASYTDHGWYRIKEFNQSDGTVIASFRVQLPQLIGIEKNDDGNFVFFTGCGLIITANPEGL